MAIDLGTSTYTKQERTWRIQILTQVNSEPIIQVLRETVIRDGNGAVVSVEKIAEPVTRKLSEIAAAAYKSEVGELTGVQIAQLLASVADTWRQEDMAVAAKAAPTPTSAQVAPTA